MRFVSRAQWGARPSKYALTRISSTRGVKVHYEGTPVPRSLLGDHGLCAGRVRALQASHLANTKENYSDIAYSALVCPHGWVFEGRGAGYKTGANGSSPLNSAHYAVCGMVGTEGITEPTDAMLHGIRDAIEWLRADGGAGPEIRGHKDGYATSCPGPALYAWVQAGAPRPGGPPPTTSPRPDVPGPTPTPRRRRMALVSKTVPNLEGDGSATVFAAVPGLAWLNVAADYVPPGERVAVRIDVSDGAGGWIHVNEHRLVGNGEVTAFEVPRSDRTRVVSVKRLSHAGARLDATLHYPEG